MEPKNPIMYELFKSDKSGKFHFRLKAGNGEPILSSEAYETKAGALGGIESVKANAPNAARFEMRKTQGGQPYFVLKAANGQTIGRSESYSSEQAARGGIDAVVKNAGSSTKDLT
jgi:uncharacterized protein YegP (UPF0339 family)